MTIFNWATAVSGDWGNAANWSPATVPNDIAADVTIDATGNYTVTIAAGESETVDSLAINPTNNFDGTNTDPYNAAEIEIDGTLAFAPGSAGRISGSLQTFMHMNGGTIINAGTVDAFIQAEGNVLFTGTNGFYVTNWLQSLAGTVTVDTSSIAEMTGNTLFDGIYEAKGPGAVIHLGGSIEHNIVNIATIEGPPGIPDGWTELLLNDPTAVIDEWNGTGYTPLEATLQDIASRATLDVLSARDYTTTNTLSIDGGLLNNQGGTFTAAAIDINTGAVQGNGTIAAPVVNNGTLMVEGGTLAVTGALTGTGTVAFDTDLKAGTAGTIVAGGATAVLGAVAAGQTIVMNGDDKLVLTNPAAFLGHIAATVGDEIILQSQTITSAIDTNGTLVLSNGGTIVANLLLAGSFAAGALTANGSIVTIGTASVNTGTITQSSSAITLADGDTKTINGTGNTVTAGTGARVAIVGASNVVNAGTGGVFSFDGAGEKLTGSNETVSTANARSAVTVVGNSNTIDASSAAGSAFELNGTGDIVNMSSGTIYADDNASFTVTGSSDAVGFSGVGTIVSSGNTIYLTTSSAAVGVTGNNNAIGATAGATLTLNGANNSVYGSDMTIWGAVGSTMFVAGTGDTANFGGAASIAISSGTINATGSAASISIAGDNNVVNDTFASSVIGITGNNETVTASGINLYSGANTSMTLIGTSDTVGMYTNSRLAVASASNIAFVTGANNADQVVVADQLQAVYNFNPVAGDRIDLSQILSGVSVTADTLGSYVSASSANGNTSLSIIGPHGSDTVVLAGVGSLSLTTLSSENAFILPTQAA